MKEKTPCKETLENLLIEIDNDIVMTYTMNKEVGDEYRKILKAKKLNIQMEIDIINAKIYGLIG